MKRGLYEILVPASASAAVRRAWEKRVAGRAGGVSILPGRIRGRWRGKSASAAARESLLPVRVACSRSELRGILRFTARHYRQKEVFSYLISSEVVVHRAE